MNTFTRHRKRQTAGDMHKNKKSKTTNHIIMLRICTQFKIILDWFNYGRLVCTY